MMAYRTNAYRRPRHAMETIVYEDSVLKRGPHASALAERHGELSEQLPFRLPRILGRGETWIRLERVGGKTSLGEIEGLLLDRRFQAATDALGRVLGLLDACPSKSTDPYDDARFGQLFDPGERWRTGLPEHCLLPGGYDFALSNVVWASDGPVLVDWEWWFPFAVPSAFTRWIVVRWTAEYLQPLVRALCSQRLPCVVLYDDVAIPEAWAAAAAVAPPDVGRFLSWECALQDDIHVIHRPFETFQVHVRPERVCHRLDDNATSLVRRLDGERWAAERRLADLNGLKESSRHLAALLRERVRRY